MDIKYANKKRMLFLFFAREEGVMMEKVMKYEETEVVELKRILNDSFEREVVAFLNTHDGIIYIGVDNDGTVVGV